MHMQRVLTVNLKSKILSGIAWSLSRPVSHALNFEKIWSVVTSQQLTWDQSAGRGLGARDHFRFSSVQFYDPECFLYHSLIHQVQSEYQAWQNHWMCCFNEWGDFERDGNQIQTCMFLLKVQSQYCLITPMRFYFFQSAENLNPQDLLKSLNLQGRIIYLELSECNIQRVPKTFIGWQKWADVKGHCSL